MARKSKKPVVIEYLFDQRWDEETGLLGKSEVSFDEVVAAIQTTGAELSTSNPANFAKDIVRRKNRNEYLPRSIVDRGYTIRQAIGQGMCFEFVRLEEGQTEGFITLDPSTIC